MDILLSWNMVYLHEGIRSVSPKEMERAMNRGKKRMVRKWKHIIWTISGY